ncbi:MAG: YcgL domain-containing protein [Paraperlucidibaca sp.]
MSRVFCSIYKSRKKDEMYVYTLRAEGIKRLPEALLTQFGVPVHVTDIMLSAERPLARADIVQVLGQIESKGFYLQMPPPREPWLINSDQAPAWRHQRRDAAEASDD